MTNFKSDIDIAREFLHCHNPKSSLLVELIDKSIVEDTVKKYFNDQITDAGKAKARLLHLYYLSDSDLTLRTVSQRLGYSEESIKKYHPQALAEIVAYIPPQYRA